MIFTKSSIYLMVSMILLYFLICLPSIQGASTKSLIINNVEIDPQNMKLMFYGENYDDLAEDDITFKFGSEEVKYFKKSDSGFYTHLPLEIKPCATYNISAKTQRGEVSFSFSESLGLGVKTVTHDNFEMRPTDEMIVLHFGELPSGAEVINGTLRDITVIDGKADSYQVLGSYVDREDNIFDVSLKLTAKQAMHVRATASILYKYEGDSPDQNGPCGKGDNPPID